MVVLQSIRASKATIEVRGSTWQVFGGARAVLIFTLGRLSYDWNDIKLKLFYHEILLVWSNLCLERLKREKLTACSIDSSSHPPTLAIGSQRCSISFSRDSQRGRIRSSRRSNRHSRCEGRSSSWDRRLRTSSFDYQ